MPQFTLMGKEIMNGQPTLAHLCPLDSGWCWADGSLPLPALLLKPRSKCCCALNSSDLERYTLDQGVGGDWFGIQANLQEERLGFPRRWIEILDEKVPGGALIGMWKLEGRGSLGRT